MAYRHRGMAAMTDLPKSIFGGYVDCSAYMTWLYTPECWKYSPSAWDQIKNFANPFSPSDIAHTPAVSLTSEQATMPAPYTQAEYQAAIDQATGTAAAQTKANILAAAQAGATQIPPDCAGAYQEDDGTWACPPSTGTNWWLWIGVAAIGAFALVALSGGSPRRYGR